jgi:hypothetical protein
MDKDEIVAIIKDLEDMRQAIIDDNIGCSSFDEDLAEQLYDIDNDIWELQQELYELEINE